MKKNTRPIWVPRCRQPLITRGSTARDSSHDGSLLLMAMFDSHGGILSSLSSFCFACKWMVKWSPSQLVLSDAQINICSDKTCINLSSYPHHSSPSSLPLPPPYPYFPPTCTYSKNEREQFSSVEQPQYFKMDPMWREGRTNTHLHTHMHTGSFVPSVVGPVSLWRCHSHPLIAVL